jgi:hypothetical protein
VTELRPSTDRQTKLLRQIVQRTAQIFGKDLCLLCEARTGDQLHLMAVQERRRCAYVFRQERRAVFGILFMGTIRLVCCGLTILLLSVGGAAAQLPPPTVTVTPHPNPSSSLVLPPPGQVPVSPGPTGTAPGAVGAIGGNLAGTNQVVNPPRSIVRSSHYRRHRQYYENYYVQ